MLEEKQILNITKRFLDNLLKYRNSQWEYNGASEFGKFKSLDELLAKLEDENPNVRLICCEILSSCTCFYDKKQKEKVKKALEKKLGDYSQNFITGSFQCEEDEIAVVSDYAAASLAKIS